LLAALNAEWNKLTPAQKQELTRFADSLKGMTPAQQLAQIQTALKALRAQQVAVAAAKENGGYDGSYTTVDSGGYMATESTALPSAIDPTKIALVLGGVGIAAIVGYFVFRGRK
jgi:hypothetical protein